MPELPVYLRVGETEAQVGTLSADTGAEGVAALPDFLRRLADEYEAAAANMDDS